MVSPYFHRFQLQEKRQMTYSDTWIRRTFFTCLLTGIFCFFPSLAFAEPSVVPSDPAFQQAVEHVVEQYLRTHPEIIEETLQILQAKREAEERERVRVVIAARQEDLLNDPNSPVSGNPAGDVTVVEFFDYRCGYCKQVAGAVTQLQKEDANVRVVYKDFPILGETSELAARAALASKVQGKHLAFHEALLASKNDLIQESLFAIATEVGLDIEQLQTDMQAPLIQSTIDRNRTLARELGISGTPGFIIGTELVPGALDLKDLKSLVAHIRKRTKGDN
jgi:protein-disulfide isomerase